MPPMSENARALFVPPVPPVPGQVIPVECFVIKLALRPFRHSCDHIFLSNIVRAALWSVTRRREHVRGGNVGANSYQKYPPAVLGNAVVLGIQNLPDHAIPGK